MSPEPLVPGGFEPPQPSWEEIFPLEKLSASYLLLFPKQTGEAWCSRVAESCLAPQRSHLQSPPSHQKLGQLQTALSPQGSTGKFPFPLFSRLVSLATRNGRALPPSGFRSELPSFPTINAAGTSALPEFIIRFLTSRAPAFPASQHLPVMGLGKQG